MLGVSWNPLANRPVSRISIIALVLMITVVVSPAIGRESGYVQSLLEMRRENVVVQKFDLSCGAAALATILNYQFGDPVTEREITTGLI